MKLTLEILNSSGDAVSTKEYKSLKAIHNDYPDIEYHQLRAIYLHHSGKHKKKFIHDRTRELISLFRIKPVEIVATSQPVVAGASAI
jgi:hypothetical protein